jgi:type IV pilus assembly protein PilW
MDTSVIGLKYSQGFTILEVLVAIIISVILMGGAIMMLSSNKRVYAVQSELAQMQSNARFVIDEFNRELRMAGYFGCSGTPPTGEPTHPFQDSENILVAMTDINNKGGFPASDKVAINSFNQKITVILAQQFLGGTTASFELDPNSDYWPKQNETIIVSDCLGSDRYEVTNNPTEASPTMTFQQLDGSTGLIRNYSIQPEVFTGKTHIAYEVKPITGGGFALYQTRCENIDQNSDPCENGVDIVEEELFIENVETLQVRYGFNIVLDDDALGSDADTDNDVLAFDDNGDNQIKLIPDFFDADYQPFCSTDTDSDGIPDTYTFSCLPDKTTVIFPIVATRITLLMRTASKRYDQKNVFTDKLFQLDPDNDSANIPYNPKNNSLESGYRHRMFTTVIAIRNAK